MMEAQLRIVSRMVALAGEHPDANVAIISHADMIKAAIAWFAGIHLDMFHRIEISPASISIIDLFPETSRLFLLNHTGEI
jgi:probable phosphoglycerate mutase